MRFKNAIFKRPAKTFVNGLTTQNLGKPDYELALTQHDEYINAFKNLGVKAIVLEPDEKFPDSCFVEDTAIVTEKAAIITNPGAETRKGEIHAIENVLKNFYSNLYYIKAPGTLDGGDVLRVDNKFYIGLSKRTNRDGAEQIKQILENLGYNAFFIQLKKYLHLKTGITYLGNNTLLIAGELKENSIFNEYKKIFVPDEEDYVANSIMVNGTLFIAKGFPRTKRKLEDESFKLIELDMSEFRKIDGGLSCLSLRF